MHLRVDNEVEFGKRNASLSKMKRKSKKSTFTWRIRKVSGKTTDQRLLIGIGGLLRKCPLVFVPRKYPGLLPQKEVLKKVPEYHAIF